jgi:hypothetical protein
VLLPARPLGTHRLSFFYEGAVTGMAKKPKQRRITGGVDTHKDTHHAAVVLMNGRRLADAQFPATVAGYRALLAWMRGFGRAARGRGGRQALALTAPRLPAT